MRNRFLRWIAVLVALGGTTAAFGQTAALTGYCNLGGTKANVSGLQSINYQQGIIPSCTVTVYLSGTNTKATIFKDGSGTTLGNPFTANAPNSLTPGQWTFWAAVNQGYDVVGSGGIAPNVYASPAPLATGAYPGTDITFPLIELNGTPISPSSPADFVDTGSVTWSFSGGHITATATGGGGSGCDTGAINEVQFADGAGGCSGNSSFSFAPSTQTININGNQNTSTTNPSGNGVYNSVYDFSIDNFTNSGAIFRVIKSLGQLGTPSKFSGNGFQFGSAPNASTPWTTDQMDIRDIEFDRIGITDGYGWRADKRATGDDIWLRSDWDLTVGGVTAYGDEGWEHFACAECGEEPNLFNGTVAAGASAGITTLPVNGGGVECAGCYVADTTLGTTGYKFAGVFTLAAEGDYYTAPVSGTSLPVTTVHAQLSCPPILAQPSSPGTTLSVTCTAINLTGPNASTGFTVDTSTTAHTLGGIFPEQVKITAVGAVSGTTQSGIVFTHRNPGMSQWAANTAYTLGQEIVDNFGHSELVIQAGTSAASVPTWPDSQGIPTHDGPNLIWTDNGLRGFASTLWEGGPQGMILCHDYWATATGSLPQCEEVWGAIDSTHIVAILPPDGAPNTFYRTAALDGLVKSGTTVTAGAELGANIFNGLASVLISGCSDASLNGSVTGFTVNTQSHTATWTQTGGGTACSTATVSYDPNASPSIIGFSLFPYAEQLAVDETHATLLLEPNGVNWANGNNLLQPHPPSFEGSLEFLGYQGFHPSYTNPGNGVFRNYTGVAIGDSWHDTRLINNNSVSVYQGHGGTIAPQQWQEWDGPNGGLLTARMPLNGLPAFTLDFPNGSSCDTNYLDLLFQIDKNGSIAYDCGNSVWDISGSISVPAISTPGFDLRSTFDQTLGTYPFTNIQMFDFNWIFFGAKGESRGSTAILSTGGISGSRQVVGADQANAPSPFVTNPGTATCLYEAAAVTDIGIGNRSGAATVSNCPNTLNSSNFVFLKPDVVPGQQSGIVYKFDGTNYRVLCTYANIAQGCNDTGQSLGAVAPTQGFTGILSIEGISGSSTNANSDINGHLTLSGGAASRTFFNTTVGTAPPECTATDTSAVAAVQAVVSGGPLPTPYVLTINGTGTDVVSYYCSWHIQQ